MDLRDIQRLHAQFAPDSMTIDLSRQIAALPAPTTFESDIPSMSQRAMSRITRIWLIRSCAAPMMVAILVALTWIGAAKVYRAVGTSASSLKSDVKELTLSRANATTYLKPTSETAARTIDATPTRPVVITSVLHSNDLDHEPVGPLAPGLLTADQFRTSINSVASTNPTNTGGPTRPASSVSDQTKTAAASPIRQSHREADAPRASKVEPPQIAQAAPQAAQGESKPIVTPVMPTTPVISVTPDAQSLPPAQTPATASTHPYRRHVVRLRDTQAHDGEQSSTPTNTKPAPTSRPGSNEVQMF
ncbi:hypothetical protein BVER_00312c [Candidatus Burkholderia verschuerenii]|uniref:Transmembrane protein n=1 Tax=Candidatus Burkholderia verschuerenii TaxID=242163 RepID=A0A0L0M5W4_9BURK|nr:hypothetical protein [Candidatus Burkholderia verschuerenii]KND58047.1 hypothetical protein BVER_00312c [Candidatus Burkholderia verschuerenii]